MNKYEKAKLHTVRQSKAWHEDYYVISGTSGEAYLVRKLYNGAYGCDCLFGQDNWGKDCSHTIAVENYVNTQPTYTEPTHTVYAAEDGERFIVESAETGELYRVTATRGTYFCTCAKKRDCSHAKAVKGWMNRWTTEQKYTLTWTSKGITVERQ